MTAAPNPVRKKLIEVSIPLEAINVASAREKSIRHGHPSTLHLWWARRPLAACRAVLFAQLVDDPSAWPDRFPTEEAQDAERRRLHKVIEAMVPWEASNDEAILNAARWEIARSVAWGLGEEPPARADGPAILDYLQTKAPPVYDPFSGGGSIPLEAQRLGLRAYGSDLNPVAVLIGKALVEIPPKFAGRPPINPKSRAEAANGQVRAWKGAQGLAEDVRYYGQWMRDEAEKRIGHLYPKATLPDGSKATVIAWLWARTVRSPDPVAKGAMVPLVSSFMLSTKEGTKIWSEPVIDPHAQDGWRFEVRRGTPSKEHEERLKKGTKTGRGHFQCVLTGAALAGPHIKAGLQADGSSARLLAVVTGEGRGKTYSSPDSTQEAAARLATPETSEISVPLPADPRAFTPFLYGIDHVDKLFSPRQITALTTFAELARKAEQVVLQDCTAAGMSDEDAALRAQAVTVYLTLAVGRAADFWSTLTVWEPSGTFISHAFATHALRMVWDYPEGNPFSSSNGNWLDTALEWTVKALAAVPASSPGRVVQAASQSLNFSEPYVFSTDPPYYDNIPYADLSDYFYVWHRIALGSTFPEIYRRLSVPKDDELVATPYRHGGRLNADKFFNEGMTSALKRLGSAPCADNPTAIYYAFKQAEDDGEGVSSAGWSSFHRRCWTPDCRSMALGPSGQSGL